MKSQFLFSALFVLCLFSCKAHASESQIIQAPPVPSDVTTPVDQAVSNLPDSTSLIDEVARNAIHTNLDGTTSMFDPHNLARNLRNLADQTSSSMVVVPDGGNVQFFPLDNEYEESSDEDLPTPIITTVVPIIAPGYPYNKTLPASQTMANLLDSASKLDQVDGYVVISNPNRTVSVINAGDLARDLREQADDLANLGIENIDMLDGGRVRFAPFVQINGIPLIDAVILENKGRNLSVVRLESDSTPVVTIVQAVLVPAFTFETIVPANQAANNLRNSASKLSQEDGYVAYRHPDSTVDVVSASALSKNLRQKAVELFDLGSADAVIYDAGTVRYASIIKVEGFSPIDAFTMNQDGTVSLINLSDTDLAISGLDNDALFLKTLSANAYIFSGSILVYLFSYWLI